MVRYEWDVETVDGDEIVNHNHYDKISEIPFDLANNERLVLVRDIYDECDGLKDRAWAYVQGGRLPTHFENPWQEPTIRVPNKFHKELKGRNYQ